ncbi:MAG: cadmium-containing carbonic anhydrase [Myxococcota bacterium]|nr:cadmium-containing carbonic anhydrase [Myxococcota bacterium]
MNKSQVEDLVDVNAEGLFKCVDGRLSDHDGMHGPKVLGGVYGIAAARGVMDLDGLAAIVNEVAAAGYVPSVHGDDHAHPAPMGCGFFKLWSLGELPGLAVPDYDAEQGQAAVLDVGGVYETLEGGHAESKVMINLVPKTTLVPKLDQRFVVDAWVTGEFNLDVPTYLTLAVETVERLNGPRVAQLIVG